MQFNAKKLSQVYCEPETYVLVHLLFRKLLCLYNVGFCDQAILWSSSCDELMNFAANIIL